MSLNIIRKTQDTPRHFNQSLSQTAVQNWKRNESVKAKLQLTVSVTMTDGGFHRDKWQAQAIIVRRADIEHIHDYARMNCTQRDYLMFRLPMKVGLRTGEIATFRIEHIDFDTRWFQVLDSKRKQLYPLPLDMVTLQLIQDLIKDRLEGYVFTRERSWKHVKADQPLTITDIWHIIHKIGEAAGIKGFKPRMLREYFAAKWLLSDKSDRSKKMLQFMLRHVYSSTTDIYADKFIFPEDIQQAYDMMQGGSPVGACICKNCSIAGGCRFKPKVKEEIKR